MCVDQLGEFRDWNRVCGFRLAALPWVSILTWQLHFSERVFQQTWGLGFAMIFLSQTEKEKTSALKRCILTTRKTLNLIKDIFLQNFSSLKTIMNYSITWSFFLQANSPLFSQLQLVWKDIIPTTANSRDSFCPKKV